MDGLRIACYVVGIVAALLLAGRLLSIRHMVARLFAVMMVAWAFNTLLLLGLLVYLLLLQNEYPVWRQAGLTLNAVLLALCPLVACVYFLVRYNGHD